MKDKSFNLGKIGKQMPYRTPEGFFGELEGKIWERAKNEGIIRTASDAGITIKAGTVLTASTPAGKRGTEEPASITPSQDPPS